MISKMISISQRFNVLNVLLVEGLFCSAFGSLWEEDKAIGIKKESVIPLLSFYSEST